MGQDKPQDAELGLTVAILESLNKPLETLDAMSTILGHVKAFAGVDADPVSAAATALAYYGLAGEYAADGAAGPGSFAVRFLDALHGLTLDEVRHGSKIRED